jgi:hypothetical protein
MRLFVATHDYPRFPGERRRSVALVLQSGFGFGFVGEMLAEKRAETAALRCGLERCGP